MIAALASFLKSWKLLALIAAIAAFYFAVTQETGGRSSEVDITLPVW